MANLAKLAILLTTDTSGMTRGFAQARQQTSQFASSLQGSNGGVGQASGMLGGLSRGASMATLSIGATTAAIGLLLRELNNASNRAQEFQDIASPIEAMLADGDKAKRLMTDIRAIALDSSLGTKGLADSAKTLLSFGVESKNLSSTLVTLGNISLGNEEKMNRLALAFGQVHANGKLMGQDLLQMVNAGFNPLQEISKATGIEVGVLRKEMENGTISAEMLAAAFQMATEKGSRFHNMLDAQSKTLTGQQARLKELYAELWRPGGEAIMNAKTAAYRKLGDGLQWLNKQLGRPQNASKDIGKQFVDPAESLRKMFAETKAAAQAAKELEAFNKQMDRLRDLGENLTKSMRTPGEIFKDDARSFQNMLQHGVISAETYARAMARARTDLVSQLDSTQRIANIQKQVSIAPASRFTASGQSAAFQSQLNAQHAAAIEKAQLEKQTSMDRHLKNIADELKNEKPAVVTLKTISNL